MTRAPRRVVQAEGDLYFAGERLWIMSPSRYGRVTFVYRFGYRADFLAPPGDSLTGARKLCPGVTVLT